MQRPLQLNIRQSARTNPTQIREFSSLVIRDPFRCLIQELLSLFLIQFPHLFRWHFAIVDAIKNANPASRDFRIVQVLAETRQIESALTAFSIMTVNAIVLQELIDGRCGEAVSEQNRWE